jgi:hypothetical protein
MSRFIAPPVVGGLFSNLFGGNQYKPELDSIDSPDNATYVPQPAATMDCMTVYENLASCQAYIALWSSRLGGASPRGAINLGLILRNLRAKQAGYQDLANKCTLQLSQPDPVAQAGLSPENLGNDNGGSGGGTGNSFEKAESLIWVALFALWYAKKKKLF